tara:strand:+ start:69 stop:764 length:696 start_codon:yes stop_codon:yes gene_type:complete
MKLALCIHGLYRPNIYPIPKHLIINLIKTFSTADVYYHTWSNKIESIPIEYIGKLENCTEPKINYHPIVDSKTDCKHAKWENYKKQKLLFDKMQHASKQILGYADLISKINKKYDVIIRARWDTQISTDIDFGPYLKEALEHPIGFMTRPTRRHNLNELIEVDKTNEADDWFCYLADVLIFHSPKHFDPKYVHKLHKEENLWPCEWGWWQVMSEPYGDIHNCYHGGAVIAR